MNWSYHLSRLSHFLARNWFILSLSSIFLVSLFLRFWRLSQFNTLVFDEVYYAKFANNYLTGTPFFQSHPPLSQYLIAFSIWLGSFMPAPAEIMNDLTGSLRSTSSYRWLNALTGSLLPLVFAGIAYQLTFRRSLTVIVALLVTLDGLFLVESRYALNNIYLILFGLLGQFFFLVALNSRSYRWPAFIFAGVLFGCCASIKWNGLGFLLGIYLLLLVSYLEPLINSINKKGSGNRATKTTNIIKKIQGLERTNILIFLTIIPALTYSLLWIPHLILNPEYNFWQVHQKIFSFHQKIGGNIREVHPYCSPWYSWIVMFRPVAYFYEKKEVIGQEPLIYDVHAMGNPVLWWFSSLAIILILYLLITKISNKKILINFPYNGNIVLFCNLNYLANLLPWMKISRCTFLYHYMAAYSFAILALAWIIDECLKSRFQVDRITGVGILVLITLSFIYWLPIYLGIPLSEIGFKMRIFLPNWV